MIQRTQPAQGALRVAGLPVCAVATDLLVTLHRLQRDKPGIRLLAVSTGLDLRDRLALL